jgi:uncharacterized protein with FMN-binding domain
VKKVIGIFMSLVLIFVIISILTFFYFKTREVPKIELDDVNLQEVGDGIYTGEYKTDLVKAVVKVKIFNHQIIEITIMEHDNLLGKKAENIVDEIVLKQSLDVDAISGATSSSYVILKAVEQALLNPTNIE